MLAGVVVSAALVAQVLEDPAVPVPARLLVLADLAAPAQRPREAELPAPARLPVVLVVPALGLAHLVVEAAVPVELLLLLSLQSFSAAMARSSP